MMTFGKRLQERKDAIVRRWLDDALASYPGDTPQVFKRQKDPFANPVGHSLRTGTQGIFEALLEGGDDDKIHQHLQEIVKIRAVQQLSPSEAVSFVFRLKDAVRAEAGDLTEDPQCSGDLAKLEAEVDRIALAAFDIFVECRERVCELRINEVKRKVSWVLDKLNQRASDSESVQPESE